MKLLKSYKVTLSLLALKNDYRCSDYQYIVQFTKEVYLFKKLDLYTFSRFQSCGVDLMIDNWIDFRSTYLHPLFSSMAFGHQFIKSAHFLLVTTDLQLLLQRCAEALLNTCHTKREWNKNNWRQRGFCTFSWWYD